MASMANNEYREIAQQILAEQDTQEASPEMATLFEQVKQMLLESDPQLQENPDLIDTDGGIAQIVMQALQQTGGDPSKFASAIGMSGPDAEDFTSKASQASPQAQAEMISKNMGYASPGSNAILQLLEELMMDQEQQYDRDVMRYE